VGETDVTGDFSRPGHSLPLFEVPASEAWQFKGIGRCSLCQQEGVYCFDLKYAAIIVRCAACEAEATLRKPLGRGQELGSRSASIEPRADAPLGQACPGCGNRLAVAELERIAEPACYVCVRQGRIAMSKDTELGMIRHEDAMRGVTRGRPTLDRADVELVRPADTSWVCAKLPIATMLELIRTPSYLAYQGENWLYCCGGPMVYVGLWSGKRFGALALDQVVGSPLRGLAESPFKLCAFRCAACKKYRAYSDVS
jgi:Uncharacterised protein family (UPF0167)